jgi:hypothetical protein
MDEWMALYEWKDGWMNGLYEWMTGGTDE